EIAHEKAKIKRLRIILAVVGVLLAAALIAVAVVLVLQSQNSDAGKPVIKNSILLEDVLQGKLNARRFNGSWVDGKTKNYIKLFRHSFLAQYDILNVENGVITELQVNNNQEYLLLASWGPVGNALIFNYNRNLYYKPSVLEKEVQITDDEYFNGIPDWVYEEEVFSSNSAVWFSPDGQKIAYIQFNDLQVSVINLPVYGEAGNMEFQYPRNRPVFYPKSGANNPFVRLFIVNLNEDKINPFQVQVPSELNTLEHIITVVNWVDNDKLLSVWMNRVQTLAYIQINNNQDRLDLYKQESKTGWVDIFSEPLKNSDGSQIAIIAPQKQSDQAGNYRHVTVLSTKSTKRTAGSAITKGNFGVQSLLHWDHGHNLIFYTSNQEKSNYLHVYAVKSGGGDPICVTWDLPILKAESVCS
uniref:Dipeptidylpeptidase IV N-terminal domain-containing protein n=1 Tax=Megaselia scalaris TaxID=36166 RepID=T1H458_MEGSC